MEIHKRVLSNKNQTLCTKDGAKIYLSNRVTCKDCLDLMSKS